MIQAKNIYFIGIGGIGMSALARLLLGRGHNISGSDMRDSATVQELIALGIKVHIGHGEDNITASQPELVIYSEDITPEAKGFVELAKAQDLNIKKMTYAEALGEIMAGSFGISVTGTNGKSTTTAILGLILEAADLDPTVIVGSKLSPKNSNEKFKANARLGGNKYFVAEADEYHRHMMSQKPNVIVLTNVAEDHLDYYKDIIDIKNAFSEFIAGLPKDGVVIYNADDHNSIEVGRAATCHKLTFGIHHYADVQAVNVHTHEGGQSFDVHFKDENIGRVTMSVPGAINVSNALGAVTAALHLGVAFPIIQKTLENFAGIWRRFEKVGELYSVPVISDYAHHPAGVAATIQATKEFFPDKKILFVFQPHHRNRTKKLLGEFIEALCNADDLILPEIYDVAGREHGEDISSVQLVAELKNRQVRAQFAADLAETERMVRLAAKDFGVIVMMGAGDIDLIARKLVKNA